METGKTVFFFNITEKSANFQKIKVIFKVSALLTVYKDKKSWNLL
jgi:hypothetical protein